RGPAPGGRRCAAPVRPGDRPAAARDLAPAGSRRSRAAADDPPYRHRWLVDGFALARAERVVRGIPRGPALAAPRSADPVRRLRRLAAAMAPWRGAAVSTRLLARAAGGRSACPALADRPAAPGDAELLRGNSLVHAASAARR